MRSLLCAASAAGILLLGTTTPVSAAAAAGAGAPAVRAADDDASAPVGFTIEDPRITESSGLAASRAHPGVYWTHNDSDDGPYLYAVDGRTGRTLATVPLRGIGAPRDVEAVSVGPDGNVYVGDIGDNFGGRWDHVWIYRFPEPKQLRDTTVTATQFTVTYADGPRDAEAMMVHPKTGRVYIASKKQGGGALYEGPRQLSSGGTNTFRKISDVDLWVTDGAFSPDGSRLVLRSYFGARMYRWQDGAPKELGGVSVPIQRQGESVTFAPDGRTLMYGSEGAGSEVEPVPLSGDRLPEGAEQAPPSGSPDTKGQEGQGSPGGDKPDQNRTFLLGAVTFGVATLVVVGLRRLLRRR